MAAREAVAANESLSKDLEHIEVMCMHVCLDNYKQTISFWASQRASYACTCLATLSPYGCHIHICHIRHTASLQIE